MTLMPSAVSRSSAAKPAGVPGTLIMTLGLPILAAMSCAAAIDPAVSWASAGSSSNDTNPSTPFVSAWTGRSTSAAMRMSSIASS